MNPIISFTFGLSMAVFSSQLFAQESANSSHASPYAGLETRTIKSLSEADIEELRRGGGWGLALPAELNGVPGPAHLLELKNEIGLSPEQIAAIEEIFTEMYSIRGLRKSSRYVSRRKNASSSPRIASPR